MASSNASQSHDFPSHRADDTSIEAQVGPDEPIVDLTSQRSLDGGEAGSASDTFEGEPARDQIPPVVPITTVKQSRARRDKVKLLREWEGVVEHVSDDTVTARLHDSDCGQRELVQFSFNDVSEDDQSLVSQGAVFYWTIGRRTDEFGSVSNFSEIRFRRLPAWTARELADAKTRAGHMLTEFFGDSS